MSTLKQLLFIMLIILSNQLQAQVSNAGVKAGANLDRMDGFAFEKGYMLGYHIGGFAAIDFSKTLGIQPEVLFSQTGAKYSTGATGIIDGVISGSKEKFNFLAIPLLLRINPSKLFTLHVGPEFGILINNDKTLIDNGKNAFNKGSFAMIAGVQINFSKGHLFGRYNVKMSDISEATEADNWKSKRVQLGIGFNLL